MIPISLLYHIFVLSLIMLRDFVFFSTVYTLSTYTTPFAGIHTIAYIWSAQQLSHTRSPSTSCTASRTRSLQYRQTRRAGI